MPQTGRESVVTQINPLLLFNRERPLLEKIKAMRIEQEHMENRMRYLYEENEQLKKQL